MEIFTKSLIIFFLIIIFNTESQAIPVSELEVTWNGILTQQEGGTQPRFNYQITIDQILGNQVSGTSKISLIDNPSYYGKMYLSGTIDGDRLTLQEGSFIENNPAPNTRWCVKNASLRISGNVMQGVWQAPGCAPGEIYLDKTALPTRWFEGLASP
jgi:hypothetical protein